MSDFLPISAIIPTRHRPEALRHTLQSLAKQPYQPIEMIVVDGSEDSQTKKLCTSEIPGLRTKIKYDRAAKNGAAVQRNQGNNSCYSAIHLVDG